MHLTGLPLATLIQIGAVLGALVVVSYILKLKRRPIAVPFSKLWERILREKEATSLFSQLKRLFSLLMQLALLGLLLFALGDPRTAAAVLEGRNLVILVDSSASMRATDGTPTRLDQAREEVRKIIRGMGGSDRALVAQMDASITPMSTMTSDLPTLEGAAASLHGTDTRADFPRALRFALDTLRGHTRPEIVVISDGRLGDARDAYGTVSLGETKLTYVKTGARARNAAISQFSVRRYPLDKSRYEVMIEVANTSEEPLDVELSLFGDNNLVDLTKFRVGPKEKLPRFYPNLSGASRALEARLSLANGERDDLPVDDHAYALLPERRRAKVLCVTKGNTYLEAALLLDEYLDVHTVSPGEYPVLQGEFDVTIFDNVAPPVAKNSGHAFYINPSGKDSPVEVKGTLEDVGFDTWEKKSPLLRWTAIADINIAKANKLAIGKEDKVVGGSFKGPLLVMGRRGASRFVALAFDLRDSDLPLRITWPLLLLNTINDFVEEDTSYISSFRTGDVWRIPVPAESHDGLLTMPDKTTRTIPVLDGHAVFVGQHAGFYNLKAGVVGSEVETEFAANLSDLEESTIGPVAELTVGDVPAGPLEGFKVGVRREIWIYLLAAALIMTTLEWVTYHRRITV
ncbi:MAG: VWA domain-containing protein [Deltaproteobacteria bacterium]|nr:VWA domain-containing protein [Deltaproteobacteria bacterium]